MTSETEIRQRFWRELSESPFLMVGLEGDPHHSLPMTGQLDPHANHCFWFYTTRDNRLVPGGAAMAQYSAKGHGLFACIDGTLSEESDPVVIDRYWTKDVAAWYQGGRTDPNLLMLRFDLGRAEIWLTDLSVKGVFRMLFGGKIADEMKNKHVEVAL
ncbi:pyridoxamine 5'-phosphate oxidase family protein [Sphingobium aquiterrae]|uniref:pyridoxamine 5'-phosphate oxidase family protein n=1 Tax=Sphingobium aquiterrae TaxID=2038656 RepID=UPI0030190F4E